MPIFASPRLIYYGEEVLDLLPDILTKLGAKRALLMTDRVVAGMGYADEVERLIEEAGADVAVFDGVEVEPSFENVEQAVEVARRVEPNVIVALGGGSVLDAAKAVWVRYEAPEVDIRGVSPFIWMGLGRRAVLIAIPMTSGTGSEATWAAVLTEGEARKKVPIASHEIVPTIAILDPRLPSSMPPRLTAATGVDALTHAVEAVATPFSSDLTNPYAFRAAEIIFEYLPRAVREPDAESRSRMHLAATMAGLAFSNSGLGAAHALGHALGGLFKVPHGVAVGVFLPYVIQYNSRDEGARARYEALARYLGLGGGDLVEKLVKRVLELYEEVGQPARVKELGIDAETYFNALERLVDYTMEDPDLPFNPRFLLPEGARELLVRAYRGEEVDF